MCEKFKFKESDLDSDPDLDPRSQNVSYLLQVLRPYRVESLPINSIAAPEEDDSGYNQ